MSGFFQNLGLQAGYDMIYGQQQARAQADTELKQQQVLAAKAQLAQQAQLTDVRSKVSQVAQAELASIKDDMEAPAQKADFAMKAAARLEAAGDLQGAASWRQQAEAYTKQGKEARETAVQRQAKTTEDLAQAALAFKTAPSAENYGQLSAAIARSGGDISKMPLPGDPALPAFVEAQTRRGMKASDQLKLLATEEDKRLQREEAARSHHENEAIRLETARTNAALRREGLEMRAATLKALGNNKDFKEAESLNAKTQAVAKPLLEDRQRLQDAKGLLAVDSPQADQQLRQDLTALQGHFKGRATNLFYKDNKNYGDLVNRVSGMLSHGFTGRFSEADRQEIGRMLTEMQSKVIDPALVKLEQQQKAHAKRYGLDPDLIELQGDFNRAPAATAPTALPAGWR
jgi:hypothetical protein